MRTTFVHTLIRLAKGDKHVWLVTGDMGFSVFEGFAQDFPKQYLNIGVAEQNMVGVSAGLALSGKKVFAYSIIPFITLRCLEQIRNDVCIQNTNVKLVGVGEGFSYGQLGPTHHSLEDIAVMRSLANMIVVCPGDPWEVEKATLAIAKIKKPAYLRIGKKGEPILHNKGSKFVLGKGIIMRDGEDLTLISTGNMLETAVRVCERLNKNKIRIRLISMHTVKPIDRELIVESAKKTSALFTIEEHSVIGGLGSAVADVVAQEGLRVKFHPFGVGDKYTKAAGSQDYLRKINGLSDKQIYGEIVKIMNHGKKD